MRDGLKIGVVGGKKLVISIPIKTLAWAFEHSDKNTVFDDERGVPVNQFKVTDPLEFANAVAAELDDEGYGEDGSTPVTRMLDAACWAAVEDGCEGVDEDLDTESD